MQGCEFLLIYSFSLLIDPTSQDRLSCSFSTKGHDTCLEHVILNCIFMYTLETIEYMLNKHLNIFI